MVMVNYHKMNFEGVTLNEILSDTELQQTVKKASDFKNTIDFAIF